MKRFLNIIKIVVVNVAMIALLLEVALRFYNPLNATVRANKVLLNRNNKTVIKNASTSKLEKNITVTTNSLGFRGPDYSADFEKRLSIITVGGSTTECFYNSDDKTWSAYLEQNLKKRFPSIWVNNAGLSGHSTYGYAILVRDYLAKLKPKVVIFNIGGNDLFNERMAESDQERFDFLHNGFNVNWIASLSSMAYRSELYNLIVSVRRKIAAHKAEMPDSFDIKSQTHKSSSPEKTVEVERELQTVWIPAFENRMSYLLARLKDTGITPVFLSTPVLFGKGIDPTSGVNLETIQVVDYDGKLTWRVVSAYNDKLKEIASKNGIFLIDLADKLPKDSKYYYDQMHFSVEGNQKIGAILATELEPFLLKSF